jgi:hypothetical protein
MPATINELVAPHGALSVQDAVRLAAFGVVLSTMAASNGGGGGTSSPRTAPGERPDGPERRDAPERLG